MALKFSAKLFSAEKSCGKSAAGLKSLLYQLCKKYGSKIPREVFFRGKFAAGMVNYIHRFFSVESFQCVVLCLRGLCT
jgi:hypothetical protein